MTFVLSDGWNPTNVIDGIRQLYKIREGWLSPLPWCEELRFHLDDIFTDLKVVRKKRATRKNTDETIDKSDIFNPQPRTALIEGDPGIGKTVYCSKLAYDWATKGQKDCFLSEFDVVLLLKCRDIKSDLWGAIDDQLLPLNIQEIEREKFFKFIHLNQSNVLLVLDGLDDLPNSKLSFFEDIIRGRILPKCHLVVTARHKAGIAVRDVFDTLLEIEGFAGENYKIFVRKYFQNQQNVAEKLTSNLDLRELMVTPLNTAILCRICGNFQGMLPESTTRIHLEIVQSILRRYRQKKGFPETSDVDNLIEVYAAQLKHLGSIAMNGLREQSKFFKESEFEDRTSDSPEFEFLLAQHDVVRRRPRLRYCFLQKSMQDFFAAFYICCQLLSEEITPEILVADTTYFSEQK